jgi:tetratricopeptide (TPR) repeat protein
MARFIQEATYLNEQGLALMASGKQHEAFESFIQAIDSISDYIRMLESKAYYPQRCLPINHRKSRFHFFLSLPETVENEAFYDSSHEDNSFSFLYNQGFRFNPCFGNRSIDEASVHYAKLYRAILTFNCALTFHQRSNGVNEDLKRTAETTASELYSEAIDYLKDCYSTLDSCRVMAAIVNNAAMLHYELQNFSQFERFQDELHTLLIDIEVSFPGSVDPRCIKLLFFNATMLNTPKTAAAA